MNRAKTWIACILLLWASGVLQHSVAPNVGVMGAHPNFLLATIGAMACFVTRAGGLWLGFGAGLIEGCVVGANLSHYIVSRTLCGFVSGWSNDLKFAPGIVTAFASAFLGTLFGQTILMFLTAPKDIAGFLTATIVTAVYNGVLAMPLNAILGRILDSVVR